MINDALLWLKEHNILLEQLNVEIVDIVTSQASSIYVDFASSDDLARLTLWESGDCDLEIISITSEKTIYWEHLQLSDNRDIDKAFLLLLNKMQAC